MLDVVFRVILVTQADIVVAGACGHRVRIGGQYRGVAAQIGAFIACANRQAA